MKRLRTGLALMVSDGVVTATSLTLAFSVRYPAGDALLPGGSLTHLLRVALLMVIVQCATYLAFGLYRQIRAHASVPELRRLVRAAALTGLLAAGGMRLSEPSFPTGLIALAWLAMTGGHCAVRLWRRTRAVGPIPRMREVEPEELLGRAAPRVESDRLCECLAGETVLVTGAGGSIGAELCRRVLAAGPRQLVLLGHGENSIFEIDRALRSVNAEIVTRAVIADIRDKSRIDAVFEQYRPGVVFHAAAHKHVPLMEDNPEEALTNNVLGTLTLAGAARRYGTKRFVLISTDKAVDPVSAMGASKCIAEHVVQSMAGTSATIYAVVRFGNVIGSRGSVIPLFQRQIAAGGPVTLTDARMERYFMTIPEAAHLVLCAASLARGGEIFVLDMGAPLRMIDLARNLIRLCGYVPDEDIKIVSTGPRPGERLQERLLATGEVARPTKHGRIVAATGPTSSEADVDAALELLHRALADHRVSGLLLRRVATALNRQARADRQADAQPRAAAASPGWAAGSRDDGPTG